MKRARRPDYTAWGVRAGGPGASRRSAMAKPALRISAEPDYTE